MGRFSGLARGFARERERPLRPSARAWPLVSTGALCIALGTAASAAAEPGPEPLAFASLQDFDKCQEQRDGSGSEACLDALKAYVKTHPKDAFEAGKRARLHYMHWVALDFFDQALNDKLTKKQCADKDVSAAVISGLSLPPHYPAVAQAKKLLGGTCRAELEAPVVAELKDAHGYFRSNACPLLSHEVSAARCRTVAEQPGAAPPPAKAAEPSAADQRAAVPQVRGTHPERKETPEPTPVHRLTEVFPPIPGTQLSAAPHDPIAELKAVDWRLLNLDSESAEVLRGAHGEELMVARTKPGTQEYVLLKFKGVRSPWNEHVLVAVERVGAAGKDYVIFQDARESVVMIERQRQYQAFPKGVVGGVWLNPERPSEQAIKLPNRRDITGEFATATAPRK